MKRFENKKVVVSGGTRGIGLAIVKEFLLEGATVAIIGRSRDRGALVLEELKGDVSFYSLDVSDHKQVKEFSVHLLEQWGHIDILVNNAGISKNALLLKITEEDWDHVLDTNLKSVYNMTYAFARNIIKNKWCWVLNASINMDFTCTINYIINLTKLSICYWGQWLGKIYWNNLYSRQCHRTSF